MKQINYFLLVLAFAWTGCDKEDIGPSFVDSRDGESYKIVEIGGVTWMAENLRYNAAGNFLNPNNPNSNYGRLYDWPTVMNGDSSSTTSPSNVQGICPDGWHLPSDEEWKTLEKSTGMSESEANGTSWRGTDTGTHLKSTSGWSNNGYGTNSNSFNAFPTGRHWNSYSNAEDDAFFWTATEFSSTQAWFRWLSNGKSEVYRTMWSKTTYAISCRCVQN